MAPEINNHSIDIKTIDFKLADLWSYGVLIYSCVYYRLPFKKDNVCEANSDVLPTIDFRCPEHLIRDGKPHPLLKGLKDLIKKLL